MSEKNEYGTMICPTDKVQMEKKTFNMEGFMIRGWRCEKCGEEAFHGKDSEIYLLYKKLLKQPVKAKVGALGKSTILRIKKEIAQTLGLEKGDNINIKIEPPNRVVLEVQE